MKFRPFFTVNMTDFVEFVFVVSLGFFGNILGTVHSFSSHFQTQRRELKYDTKSGQQSKAFELVSNRFDEGLIDG